MSKFCLDSNHYFLASSNNVAKLCKHFFNKSNVHFFDYGRIYSNGYFYGLTINPDSFRIFFDLAYPSLGFCNNSFEQNKVYYLFAPPSHPDYSQNQILKEVYKVTKSDHGYIIFDKNPDYADLYYFSVDLPYQHGINFFLNNIMMFTEFINHFKLAGNKLLDRASDNQLILPNEMQPRFWQANTNQPVKKSSCTNQSQNVSLTNRESQCAELLCNGYTYQEMAETLNLSRRTIESYVEHLKQKLNISKKSQLVRYLINTNYIYTAG